MYGRVIVPLDGSRLAEQALAPARDLAKAFGAGLVLLSVADSEDRVMQLKAYLIELDADRELGAEFIAVQGTRPAEAIRATAEKAGDAMVVMGTHGRGGVRRAVLGSVAEEVLATFEGPLVLIGPSFRPGPALRPLNLIACVDGSETSEAVLPVAVAWAQELGLRLRLVHVVSPFFRHGLQPGMAREEPGLPDDFIDAGYVAALSRRLRAGGADPEWEVLYSPYTVSAVVGYAAALPGSIVAVATHGRTGLERLAMGSVAGRIVRESRSPVLVARRRPPEAV